MKKHLVYRIINIFLLPAAAYIAINVLMSVIVSFTNPLLLLVNFVFACIPLYAFSSNYFFNRGIRNAQPCKPGLKDWIKVNAYVSFIFGVLMFLGCLMMLAVLNNPVMLQEFKVKLATAAPIQIPQEQILRYMKISTYIFLPFTVLLIVHIIITLRLLKHYRSVFETPAS